MWLMGLRNKISSSIIRFGKVDQPVEHRAFDSASADLLKRIVMADNVKGIEYCSALLAVVLQFFLSAAATVLTGVAAALNVTSPAHASIPSLQIAALVLSATSSVITGLRGDKANHLLQLDDILTQKAAKPEQDTVGKYPDICDLRKPIGGTCSMGRGFYYVKLVSSAVATALTTASAGVLKGDAHSSYVANIVATAFNGVATIVQIPLAFYDASVASAKVVLKDHPIARTI